MRIIGPIQQNWAQRGVVWKVREIYGYNRDLLENVKRLMAVYVWIRKKEFEDQ